MANRSVSSGRWSLTKSSERGVVGSGNDFATWGVRRQYFDRLARDFPRREAVDIDRVPELGAGGAQFCRQRPLTRLRDALPDAQVLVVEPYWPARQWPPRIRRVFDLHAECAEETGLPFLVGQNGVFDGDHLPFLYPEPDQLHPNDRGHARLAEVMTGVLEPYVAKARVDA